MSSSKGKGPSEIDTLRRQIEHLTIAVMNSEEASSMFKQQAVIANNALATVLHSQGLDGVKTTIAEQKAATEFCWLRVQLDVVEEDDGSKVMQLRLLAVTDEERATAVASAKKQRKQIKKAKKTSGPRLLGPDGNPL